MKWVEHPKDTGFESDLVYQRYEPKRGASGDFTQPKGVLICVCTVPCGGQCKEVAAEYPDDVEAEPDGIPDSSPYAVLARPIAV
jgi:hypothetical protein